MHIILLILGFLAFVMICAIFAFGLNLEYRRKFVRARYEPTEENEVLAERVDELEQRCSQLEEQMKAAQELLADEKGQLDRRLRKMLARVPEEKIRAMDEEVERTLEKAG